MVATRNETTGRWFLDGVEPEAETYERILMMLKENVNFKFARYGDGEINAMTGKRGRNCDGHEYFPDLGARLVKTVAQEPPYMVGIQPLSVSHLPNEVAGYFDGFTLYNADVLHSASIDGVLGRFFDALGGRYIILVGPPHLAGLFDCVHIVVPTLNCWLHYENIKEQMEFHFKKDCVFLLSASMMSEILIADFQDFPCTMIDTGSVLDPFAGVNSRKYHFKLKRS